MELRPSKICATCGRSFAWRKKWARDWERVRYCSDRCREGKRVGDPLEADILGALEGLGAGKTICPSQIARERWPEDWRPQMEAVRQAARRLVAAGQVVITQGGRVVDPDTARGPIRLRRA